MRDPIYLNVSKGDASPRALTCVQGKCGGVVPDDAPVSLCPKHLILAYSYCLDRLMAASPEQLRSLSTSRNGLEMSPELRQRVRQARSVVYYAASDGLIKIGTTIHLDQRMASLGANLLVTEPGARKLERSRHEQFAHLLRKGREYFFPGPELLIHITALLKERP